MTDIFDRAQEREEQMRQDALAEQARRAQPTTSESATHCACSRPIPEPRRQAVPGVQTCIECQTLLEGE
jgi:phage/conjugal plasmid C-4 type zinc finger TraR family protein